MQLADIRLCARSQCERFATKLVGNLILIRFFFRLVSVEENGTGASVLCPLARMWTHSETRLSSAISLGPKASSTR